jgi:hypothetical protein
MRMLRVIWPALGRVPFGLNGCVFCAVPASAALIWLLRLEVPSPNVAAGLSLGTMDFLLH